MVLVQVHSALRERRKGRAFARTVLLTIIILVTFAGFRLATDERNSMMMDRSSEDEKDEENLNSTFSGLQYQPPLQKMPLISVILLTGGRISLARETLSRIVSYFSLRENDIAYDILWIDNGVSQDRHKESLEMEQLFRFEQVLRYRYNSGIGRALNNAFLVSRAPYALLLEEDWFLLDGCMILNSTKCPTFVASSIHLLSHEARAMRAELVASEPGLKTKTGANFLRCPEEESYGGWGGWSNRPTIVSKEKFLKLGGFEETIPAPLIQENDLSRRANKAGMCSFIIGTANHFRHQGQIRSPLNQEKAPPAKKGASYVIPEFKVYQQVVSS